MKITVSGDMSVTGNIKVKPVTVAAKKQNAHVRHAVEGVDPKTGQKMLKTDLTGAHTAQQVWFNPQSRVALPVKE